MAQGEQLTRWKRGTGVRVANGESPLIRFYQMISGGRRPERADDGAAGTMPARAYRLCEAMRHASAFGWYLYPPIAFSVMWDGGADMFWAHEQSDAWQPIRTVYFPGFQEQFERAAPPSFGHLCRHF